MDHDHNQNENLMSNSFMTTSQLQRIDDNVRQTVNEPDQRNITFHPNSSNHHQLLSQQNYQRQFPAYCCSGNEVNLNQTTGRNVTSSMEYLNFQANYNAQYNHHYVADNDKSFYSNYMPNSVDYNNYTANNQVTKNTFDYTDAINSNNTGQQVQQFYTNEQSNYYESTYYQQQQQQPISQNHQELASDHRTNFFHNQHQQQLYQQEVSAGHDYRPNFQSNSSLNQTYSINSEESRSYLNFEATSEPVSSIHQTTRPVHLGEPPTILWSSNNFSSSNVTTSSSNTEDERDLGASWPSNQSESSCPTDSDGAAANSREIHDFKFLVSKQDVKLFRTNGDESEQILRRAQNRSSRRVCSTESILIPTNGRFIKSDDTDSRDNDQQLQQRPRSNQCNVCGRLYARPSTLKTHLRTHTNERPFKCNVCSKTFSQAANLTAHQRVHTGERPFPCPICHRKFSQSSSVITHLRTHSGERPYRCNMCRRTFSDSSTLTKHCRIHSGEKPYQCDYCPLNFSQSGNLSRHLKLHSSASGNISLTGGGSSSASTNKLNSPESKLNQQACELSAPHNISI